MGTSSPALPLAKHSAQSIERKAAEWRGLPAFKPILAPGSHQALQGQSTNGVRREALAGLA